MRVLVVIPDKYSYGGTSRFLEQLLLLHQRNGIKTALLVPAHHRSDSLVSLAARYKIEIFSEINRVRKNTLPVLTPFFDFAFAWCAVKSWCPDLLVVSTGDPGRMSVALYFPIPALYFLHTIPETCFRFLPRFYLRMGSQLNNRIVAVSRAAAESISMNMGIPLGRISVVYNSCQLIQNEPHVGMPIVMTAGHLVPYKNPFGWLKVAQRVIQQRPDITFVWLGDGELLASMREMVMNLGLGERILLPGFVSNPYTWYVKSQVYFQPSLRESHGIAVLEAMACGLPCVVADTGGLPESVVENETGFVCAPGDETGFASHILNLLEDNALRERMGTAGHLRVEQYFSETEQEQKIISLYKQMAPDAAKRCNLADAQTVRQ